MRHQQEVEKIQTDAFIYRRFSFRSEILGKEIRYGLVDFAGAPEPRGFFHFLHGGNGDDRQLMDIQLLNALSPQQLQRLRDSGTRIVLPYVGTSFLHDHPSDPARRYTRYFLDEVLPRAEQAAREPMRWIAGFSMGGQAALNLFLRFPEKFAGAGAHFATLVGFDYTSAEEAALFQARNKVTDPYMQILMDGYRAEFTGIADFRSIDPITLASSIDPARLKGRKLYFDVGSDDDFGLAEGAAKLGALLDQRGIPSRHEIVAGGRHDGPFLFGRFPTLVDYLFS